MNPFRVFDSYYAYWDESTKQHQKMIKFCGGVSPRTYGESIKRSKKKRKKVMRGK